MWDNSDWVWQDGSHLDDMSYTNWMQVYNIRFLIGVLLRLAKIQVVENLRYAMRLYRIICGRDLKQS